MTASLRWSGALAVAVVTALSPSPATHAQQTSPQTLVYDGLEAIRLTPAFYVIAGAGANIGVQLGVDGAVVVDSGTASKAPSVVALIKMLTPRPIRFVINTTDDADHVGGNEVLSKAGQSVVSPANAFNALFSTGQAQIIAHERVLARMGAPTGSTAAFPADGWPTNTYADRQKVVWINDEGVQVIHKKAAHTDGDSIVHFRRNDVVMLGDIVDMTRFPVVDVARGGSIQGELDALNDLVELVLPVVPMGWREGGTQIVPGHGWPGHQADVVEYRDMVTIVRDRVADGVKKGLTLDRIKASNPTQGFRTRYGRADALAPDRFVESIHASLTAGGK
jgi:glyoxylase-like metal-dependent hydrolase (beta-lactamase superfamily II)